LDVADASAGSLAAFRRLRRAGIVRQITPEELERARERAAQIGRDGEALVNAWLERQREKGTIYDFHWASDENAIQPFDFCVELFRGSSECWEVKTTNGGFSREFHLSLAEI